MKILFIDSYSYAYDTRTYLTQPMGGTQSAVSALAKALVEKGHNVFVINGVKELVETDGVRFMGLPCPTPLLNSFDVIVLVSAPIAEALRSIGCTKPLILWSHHATDQPAMQPLLNPAEQALYAGFAFVSEWQAKSYIASFGIAPSTLMVMRNAASSAFLKSTSASQWLKKGSPPILAYSSTPYRGLDILLLSFASIRKRLEGATLRIFSSMGIYSKDTVDEYSSFYDLAEALPGVSYVGSLPQPQLAAAMAEVDIWAYPSTFAETSCISAMEAMASGCLIVSTTLGALPETTAEFGYLLDSSAGQNSGMAATRFAEHLVKVADTARNDVASTEAMLARQVDFARTQYTWEKRAIAWSDWLQRFC